ncbi:uncharacterized protein C1orf127 homolog [Trichosurus vulpecula]|uniref:uncharacterized protein C1orf127 homolog n=1 Tax=Trichosurus vulpecula TaxID=9337 RepID=UPI00186AF270|nr:uncharacterized protein C1orf127 homolog [Trichosurus vulpecula]
MHELVGLAGAEPQSSLQMPYPEASLACWSCPAITEYAGGGPQHPVFERHMLLVICLTCALSGALPFKAEEVKPDQMVEISTDDIECFSDYMALWIPKSHVYGLKQWLSRTLNIPVNWGSMERVNSFLARCGYFLHPDSAGSYIFQARYTACFMQQEKANYLLEIRIFPKGIKSFGRSDRYILKCPVITSRLSQESILCGPDTIQVSRPMPQGNASRQSPWLLSLRGELMASLEDASLLGLYVETNTTTITILGPRQQLLQRKEVLNTSVDFLSLWMVSGYYAYSLEAMCPLVLSQPGPEILVQIPKQGLGLVKRGARYTEVLTLRDLRVSQSNSFMVTENRDFVVVSIPPRDVLQSQQCQEAQGVPGMQSFYRIDLSLEFAEVPRPICWTVENFFRCAAAAATAFSLEGWPFGDTQQRQLLQSQVITGTPGPQPEFREVGLEEKNGAREENGASSCSGAQIKDSPWAAGGAHTATLPHWQAPRPSPPSAHPRTSYRGKKEVALYNADCPCFDV